MTVPVRYYCPHCGAIATLERDAYLADKSVTPFPLEGWTYASPTEDFEDADGVRIVCGDLTDETGPGEHVDEVGCGDPFYLNFVRFEDGREIERPPESEYVKLNDADGLAWPGR